MEEMKPHESRTDVLREKLGDQPLACTSAEQKGPNTDGMFLTNCYRKESSEGKIVSSYRLSKSYNSLPKVIIYSNGADTTNDNVSIMIIIILL